MKIRSKVKLVAVSLKDYDAFSKDAVARYEEELLEAEKNGIKVRALILCTPHNPLGQYYTFFTKLIQMLSPKYHDRVHAALSKIQNTFGF
jgi:bifunctional pyridoxal-dependent enzyme with beta-cystathionase and maltose regulon repressor activities